MAAQTLDAAGFVVVRKPECIATTSPDSSNMLRRPPGKLIYYHGIDRDPWEEISLRYYAKKLPKNISAEYDRMRDRNRAIGLATDCNDNYDRALEILEFSNTGADRDELIIVQAPWVKEGLHTIPIDGLSIEWLGYDCGSPGEWSLILQGCFWNPQPLPTHAERLNGYGLFDEWTDCEGLYVDYVEASRDDSVEPLCDHPEWCSVRIGRVQTANSEKK